MSVWWLWQKWHWRIQCLQCLFDPYDTVHITMFCSINKVLPVLKDLREKKKRIKPFPMVLCTALETTYYGGWQMWNKQKAFKELHSMPFGWLKHRSIEMYYFMWCSLGRKIWNYFFMNQSAGQKWTQVGNWFERGLADPHHCHCGQQKDGPGQTEWYALFTVVMWPLGH